jgi:glycosyltransferase involved in cell wall biosynthesis
MIRNLANEQSLDPVSMETRGLIDFSLSSDSPLKIAMVTSFPSDPQKPSGGVEAVSVNLVRSLAKFPEFKIHVVTTDRFCSTLQISTWENATIHRLPWTAGRVLSHTLGMDKIHLRRYLDWLSPDLIHSHDIYGIMVRRMTLPRIFTIHGFIADDTRQSHQRWCLLRSRVWSMVEHYSWADQPHIIAISPYVREHLKGISRGTIHDIENPISESFFNIKHDGGHGIIFSAAMICPRKNTLGLIEAFRRLINRGVRAQLRLAGKTTNAEYEKLVRQTVQHAQLDHCVTLLGSLSSEQVREELSRADVFALVSYEEGAPMGIAEAMAAGVPVVTSNRCGMPYMVHDGETGFLVNPDQPDDIALCIEKILKNRDLAQQMGERSKTIAMDRYHPDRVAQRTRDVYLRALSIR